jgi:tetratricopeptide (TPR) repeat protein
MKNFLPICLFLFLLQPVCGRTETKAFTTFFSQVFTRLESENDAVAIVTAKARYDLFETIGLHVNELKINGMAPSSDDFYPAVALGITQVDPPNVSLRQDNDAFGVRVEVTGTVDFANIQENVLKFTSSHFRFSNALAARELGKRLFFELERVNQTHERERPSRRQTDAMIQEGIITSERRRLARRLAALTINEQIIFSMPTDNAYADSVRTLKKLYKAIDLESSNEWLFLHRGLVESHLMDTAAAERDFDNAIQINPYSSIAFYLRGRFLLEQQDFEGAIQDFNESIALNTRFALPLIYRGKANKRMNRLKLAIIDFTRAINKNPKNPDGYIERGMAYFGLGSYRNAIEDYDTATALTPNTAEVHLQKGKAQLKAGSTEAACDSFRKACQNGNCSGIREVAVEGICQAPNPEEALAWSRKSFRHVVEKRWQDAIVAASMAISYQPGMIDPYINRAWAYAETGNFEAAVQDCNKALAIDPQRAEIFNNRGLAYHRQGNEAKAVQDYLKACQLGLEIGCQNYLEIKQTLVENSQKTGTIDNLLRKSASHFKQKDWQSVLRITARVLSIDPANVIAYANRSAAYSYMGQLDDAMKEADKAIAMNSKFGLAYNNRGYALELMGKTIDAVVDYRLGCLYTSKTACDNYHRLEPTLR